MNTLAIMVRWLWCLSVLAMIFWAFLWPFVINEDATGTLFHRGSITILMVFFASTLALLAVRVVRGRAGECG